MVILIFMKYGKLNKGTEGYRSFSKLGQSSVTDFTVSAGTGTTYTYNNNWNVNDSFMQKNIVF